MIEGTELAFAGCGMAVRHAEDIGPFVVRSMEKTHDRKLGLINRMWMGKAIAREFAATKDSLIYRSLKSGGTRYLCKILEKSEELL